MHIYNGHLMSSRTRKQASKRKHYCFTINNPSKNDEKQVLKFAAHEWCSFLVYQHEVGEEGTYHLQGFLSLVTQRRFKEFLLYFPRARMAKANGKPSANLRYCSKDESRATIVGWSKQFKALPTMETHLHVGPFVFGEVPAGQGRRTDLAQACQIISDGGSLGDVAKLDLSTAARYSRNLNDLKFILMRERAYEARDIDVLIINGPTGSGKSHLAYEMGRNDPNGYFVLCAGSTKSQLWFDGYEGEGTLVMDEFRPTWCTYSYLLRLLDKWPLRLPMKGSHTWALWTKVIITTTHPLGTWYDVADTATGELYRRITRTITQEARYQEPDEELNPPQAGVGVRCEVVGSNVTTTSNLPRAPPEAGYHPSFLDREDDRFGEWAPRYSEYQAGVISSEVESAAMDLINDEIDNLF